VIAARAVHDGDFVLAGVQPRVWSWERGCAFGVWEVGCDSYRKLLYVK